MKRGRKQTTGRYETVDELHEAIKEFYYGGMSISQTARVCRVSLGTASKHLDGRVEYAEKRGSKE